MVEWSEINTYEKLRIWLNNGNDINDTNYINNSPLHLFCENYRKSIICQTRLINIISFLIENNANINQKNIYNCSPLHNICKNNSQELLSPNELIEIMNLLLKNGANINQKNINGATPLHYVCKYNPSIETINFLLEKGANINEKDYDGWAAFHYIFYFKTQLIASLKELISFLIEKSTSESGSYGIKINDKDNYGFTTLHCVCSNNNPPIEIISFLIDNLSLIHI